jgi:hypothetical protein
MAGIEPRCLVLGNVQMSVPVKGFRCHPVRAGSGRAEGRRPKASSGGSRGPGPCAMGISPRGLVGGIVRGARRQHDAPTSMPGSLGLAGPGRDPGSPQGAFRYRGKQDRPLSRRDRQRFLKVPPRRHRHEVSILTARMVRGAVPGPKRSTKIMRPPQQGQGGLRSSTGSDCSAEISASRSAVVVAGVGAAMISKEEKRMSDVHVLAPHLRGSTAMRVAVARDGTTSFVGRILIARIESRPAVALRRMAVFGLLTVR